MSCAFVPPLPSFSEFLRQGPVTLASDPLLQRQAARESNARSYPRRIPLALQQAHGIYLRDTRGQVFMDCLAGAGTLALGHNHACAVAAMRQTLDSVLPLHTLDLTTPVKDAFIETLFSSLPQNFAQPHPALRADGRRCHRSRPEAGEDRHRAQRGVRLLGRLPRHDARGHERHRQPCAQAAGRIPDAERALPSLPL